MQRPTHSTVKQGEYFTCRAALVDIAAKDWPRSPIPNYKRWEQSVMRKLDNEQRKTEGKANG